MSDLSQQMNDMRASLAEDEDSALIMQALRGTNLNDDDAAASGTTMRVVEMRRGEGDDQLPLEYNPEALGAYFAQRPLAVVTRIAQIAGVAGFWGLQTGIKALQGKLTPPNRRKAAIPWR